MSTETAPCISVVIPAYNAANWISEALAGVMAQTYQDFEIIVVDDGSTDATVQQLSPRDDRLRLVQQNNGGTASARNRGMRMARGRYVAFLDADDIWLPAKLEQQLELFRHNPELVWCYGNAIFFDGRSGRPMYTQSQIQKQLQGDVLRALLLSNFIPVSSVMVKRVAFNEVGYFNPTWPTCEDRDLWLRLAARYQVGYLREPMVRYRVHSDQKTKTIKLDHILQERLAMIQTAVCRDSERLADLYSLAASNLHSNVGWEWFNLGEHSTARHLFWQAIRIHPSSTRAWIYWLASFVPDPILQQMIKGLRLVRKML